MKPIPVFVGYDPREAIAYHVCVNSIIRTASGPVSIVPVALNLFKEYQETHGDGSNHFIYTRFLVPYLMDYTGWAIFIDGDMVLRDDIYKLWHLRQLDKDVMVVKHDYKTRMKEKYLDAMVHQPQVPMQRLDFPKFRWVWMTMNPSIQKIWTGILRILLRKFESKRLKWTLFLLSINLQQPKRSWMQLLSPCINVVTRWRSSRPNWKKRKIDWQALN